MSNPTRWQDTRCRISVVKPHGLWLEGVHQINRLPEDGWDIISRLYRESLEGKVNGLAVCGTYVNRTTFTSYSLGNGTHDATVVGALEGLKQRILARE